MKSKKTKKRSKKIVKAVCKIIDILEVMFLLFVFITLINFMKNNVLGICENISIFYIVIRVIVLYTKRVEKL